MHIEIIECLGLFVFIHILYIYSPLDFQHRNGNPTRLPRDDPGDPHRVSVEAVSLTNLEVIEIVSWGDFQCTSAKPHLVGGWTNPIWKIWVKMGIFPRFGVNIKNSWNHHLVIGEEVRQNEQICRSFGSDEKKHTQSNRGFFHWSKYWLVKGPGSLYWLITIHGKIHRKFRGKSHQTSLNTKDPGVS